VLNGASGSDAQYARYYYEAYETGTKAKA
jgi:hypothetical protein